MQRISPLTGSPRLAANPANAILNYLYSVLESEARLAAAALGLDPGMGVLHVDTPARDSLACDLMEPVRAQVDAYLLDWITRQPLRREWFVEQSDGNCRLLSSFAVRLAETAPIWGRAVAPIAELVARAFWSTIHKPDAPIATRLTQNNKRTAKASPTQSPYKRLPSPQNVCLVCGNPIERSHRWCSECAQKTSTTSLIAGAKLGRVAAQRPKAKARRSETKRRHDLARSNWCATDHPSWLTEENYIQQVQPGLANVTLSQLATALGVSIPYASDIRRGRRRPHPRHWKTLARLAGIQESKSPDGGSCRAETTGLLKRSHVIAGEIRYVGKETDRKWEEGDEISLLDFSATEYGRKNKVVASDDVKAAVSSIGINKCARESGFDRKNFSRKLVRGLPVKRNSYNGFLRWFQVYKLQNSDSNAG